MVAPQREPESAPPDGEPVVIERAVVDNYYARGIGLIERRFSMGDTVVTSKLQRMTLTQE